MKKKIVKLSKLPVHSALKFSQVFGHRSENNSKMTLPAENNNNKEFKSENRSTQFCNFFCHESCRAGLIICK